MKLEKIFNTESAAKGIGYVFGLASPLILFAIAGPIGLMAGIGLGVAGLFISQSENKILGALGGGLRDGASLGAVGTACALLFDNPILDALFSNAVDTVHSIEGLSEVVNDFQSMLPN